MLGAENVRALPRPEQENEHSPLNDAEALGALRYAERTPTDLRAPPGVYGDRADPRKV